MTSSLPALARDAQNCLPGRRGPRQDRFLGLEFRIRDGPSGSGYIADLEVEDWREFPNLPVMLDLTSLRALEADVNAYGLALGHAVFDDEACGAAYKETLAVARSAGRGLRVRLVVESPELQEIHWERIYYPYAEDWQPLGSTAATPFSRYVPVRQWDRPAPVERQPLRMLVVISSPADLDVWGLDPIEAEERQALHAMVDGLRAVEPVYLESGSVRAPTLNEIRRALSDGCDLAHFLCHGGRTPGGTVLYLEDEAGNVEAVTAERLVDVVRVASTQPACCFLAACESAARTRNDAQAPLGPALVDEGGVHAAVAMTERVGLYTAQAFAAQFYARLLSHGLVDLAVNEARALVQDEWDWSVPVLFMRVADGRLLAARPAVWCLTLRIVLVALAALIATGAAVYPIAQPILNPTQMTGGFKIAVAEFGQVDDHGRLRSSPLGSTVSKAVFDKLNDEYQEHYAQLLGDDAQSVQIWHDSLGPEVKNVKFGVIRGETPEERAAKAGDLADRINADLVIYGNLADNSQGGGLQLEFYNRSQTLQGEPDAVTGRHVVGEPILLPPGYENEPMATLKLLNSPLSLRTAALFWVTVALTYDVINRQQDALHALLQAREQLAQWQDKDGQALLEYFIGRESFWLRNHDMAIEALNEAIRLKPEYANAYITLSAVYYDQAQLFYTPQPIPEGLASCISAEDLEQGARSADEAMELIDRSIETVQQAIEIAPDAPWPPIEAVAHLVQGHTLRLKGQAYLLNGELDEAEPWFAASLDEFARAEQAFEARHEQQYLAWTHLGVGATHHLQALARVAAGSQSSPARDAELQQGVDLFRQAAAEYQSCIDIGQSIFDLVFRQKVLDCGCKYYLTEVEKAQTQVETYLEGE